MATSKAQVFTSFYMKRNLNWSLIHVCMLVVRIFCYYRIENSMLYHLGLCISHLSLYNRELSEEWHVYLK